MSTEFSSIVLPGSGLWPLSLAGLQPVAGEALRRLEGIYWYPIYAWWRRAGLPPNKAIFATEGAFERWLGTEPPRAADAGAARMREWVLGRLEGLASGGVKLLGAPPVAVDPEWAEKRFAEEPECAADVLFHRRWALTVLETAVEMLRAEHSAPAMAERFSLLLQFLSYKNVGDELYEAAAARSGMTAGALHGAVAEFRKRHREILRMVIADTVTDSAELEEELNELLAAAARDSGPNSSAPTKVVGLSPDELFARGMRSVELTTSGGWDWVPPTIEEAVRLFPQYEIIEIVARGGMGVVYKARQATLDRMVGIKLMPLEVSANREFAARFTQEARTMAHLSHPHIIAVYNFGQTAEGHLFFVMEFVEGANLHQLIHGEGLAPERALAILDNVLDALDYAHGKGVVHRDIKPANVMVDIHGCAKVADFGLARLNQPGAALAGRTMTCVIMGTPDYMAPEQSRDMKVDHRADIYSLGVMLYEMLVRDVPRGIFEPPSRRVAVDARLDAVVIKAMQQARDRRFQSSAEMRSALTAIRTKRVPRTHAAPVPVPVLPVAVAKPRSRGSLFIAVGVGVAALLAAVFWPKPPPLGPTDAEKAFAARGLAPRVAPTPVPTPAVVSKPTPPPEKSVVAVFGDSRYRFVAGALSWMEAKAAAEALGGRLATISSREEDEFIRQTFGPTLGPMGHFAVLGGYRLTPTAGWQWVGDEPWGYEEWPQGEPSHAAAKAADMPVYLALSRLGPANGGGIGWNDKMQSESVRADFAVRCRGFIVESAPDALAVRDAAEKERWKDALAGAALPEGWRLADGVLTHPAAAVSTWQPEARMRDGAMRVAFEWTAAIGVQLGIRNDGTSMIRLTFTPAAGIRIERYLVNDRSAVLLVPEVKLHPSPISKDTVRIEVRAIGEVVLISVNDHVFAVRDAEPKEGQAYLWIKKESVQTVSKFELLNLDPVKPVVAETKPAPMPDVPAAPVPTPTPTESDTAKWLAGVDAQWQAAYQRDIVAPFEKANADLRQQYIAALDKNVAAASLATKLNEALVWRNEKVRVGTQAPHDAPNDPTAPAALLQLRDTWRKNFGKVDQDRLTRAKALQVRYDALLDQNQKALTQRQRLDEAQLLKTRRDEITRDWLKPALGGAAPVVAAPAALAVGKLKGRDALDYLLAGHWRVVVEELGKRVIITSPEKIPHGPFEITELLTPDKVEKDAKPLTDDDLSKLGPMRGLRKFELRGAPITGAGLGFLATADDLTDMVVDTLTLTDAVYSAIAGNRKVKRLTLRGGKDFTLARLAELPCISELQYLDVRAVGSFIPPAILVKARNMQQMFIERPAISADQLTALASLPDLARLSFNNCQSLPATGWKTLERTKLEHLNFQNSPLVGIDLSFIAAMRKLESIEIDPADAPQLARVTGAPALRSVALSPARPGTDAALTAIATAFPRLESLVIGRASQPFTAVGIRALAKLSKLASVTFTSPKVTDEQLAAIAEFPAMETLRMGGAGITNEQVALLAKSKSLAVLFLNGTPLTADAIEPLKTLRGLRELDIRDTEIPPAATAELRKALPKCKIER